MMLGGLFSVTLSVTWDLPQVPSLSRGMPPFGVRTFLWREYFKPAIACHIVQSTIEGGRDPASSKRPFGPLEE